MASSKLMASSTSRNSDLIRRRSSSSSTKSSSISELSNHVHHRPTTSSSTTNYFEPTTVDGLLRNVYVDNNEASESTLLDAEITLLDAAADAAAAISDNEANAAISDTEANVAIRWQEIVRSSNGGNKTVDDVWKEIVAGRSCKQEVPDEMMTLEDFLAKAGVVEEEDVKVVPQPLPTESLSGGIYSYDSLPVPVAVDGALGFGNGVEVIGGRGKRRAILEPLDKAAQQRQRRMIKNRESAARSRERKQAYQVELESLAVKLEEEHEVLLKEKAERTKERFKQLMENIIPVVEKRRPARVLKRVRSMQW